MRKPKACILKTDGINCDEETAYAVTLAKGDPEIVHINELRSGRKRFMDYAFLVIPGGFSYGDDIASGRVLANELVAYFRDELQAFIEAKHPVLGICNGFQVLVRAGILPFVTLGNMQVTLAANRRGHFECRWVGLNRPSNCASCIFTESLNWMRLPVANGESRFGASSEMMERMVKGGLIQYQYARDMRATEEYPQNPSGAQHAVAAISDPSGLVLGMMPHPERYVRHEDYPNWRREGKTHIFPPPGLVLFRNAVAYAKHL